MRKNLKSVIDVTATSFLVLRSVIFFEMLATSVLEMRSTSFLAFGALFALMVSGFSRFGIRRRRPCCEHGVSTARGNFRDWYTLQYESSPVFTHTTFPNTNSQVVCCRERLHVNEFDETAILFFERVSNCTNFLCFDEVSMYCYTLRFWVYPDRIELLPDLGSRTSGSRLLRLLLPAPWMMECMS